MILDLNAIIKKTVGEAIKAGRKDTDAYIQKAVKQAVEAGRTQESKRVKDTYKATELRLYAYPDLRDKIETDQDYLYDVSENGLGKRSTDLIRFQKAGVRLSEKEIIDSIVLDYTAKIAATKHEIQAIDAALAPLTSDPYYRVITAKYFEGLHDDLVAKELDCDPSTVRKNRGKLVHRLAVRLYGVEAL